MPIVLDAKRSGQRTPDKRVDRALLFWSQLELMAFGLRGGALPFHRIGFILIQCGH